jgi:drug/metabolite transporter (DMT)-like permease
MPANSHRNKAFRMALRNDIGHSTLLPSLAVLATGCVWGLFWYPLRAVEAEGVSGDWVNLVFFCVCATVILPWALRRKALAEAGAGQWLIGLLLGTAFTFYTLSLVMTEVVRAILLFYLTPVWSSLLGVAFLGQRLTGRRALALSLGFAGLWLIIRNEQGIPIPENAGDWIGLLAGLCWSLGTLGSYHRPSGSIPVSVLAFSLGGVAVTLVAMAIRNSMGDLSTDMAALGRVTPLLLILAILMFSIPNVLVLWAAQRVEPARMGILLLAEALTGTISAALLSTEPFGPVQAAGATLIVAAAVVEVIARE